MSQPPALFANVLQAIGNTPMVQVNRLDTGPCTLLLKMESQNPGGSIKDRIGVAMIEAAEADGSIRPGGTLVEATAGNTGLGLALVAAQKGYRLLIVMPDKMSQEKVFHLEAMGAEVLMTRSDVAKGHPDYYQDKAEALAAAIDNAFFVNQFGNPANPRAHETTTGPEIWAQSGEDLDAMVCGVGSGGTITGLSRYFAQVAPDLEMVLADPQGSILAEYVNHGRLADEVGSWMVEGIGEDFLPPICDLSRTRRAYTIPDAESFATCRELLRSEGIFAGTSSGTLIAAALRYCREQSTPKRVCTFVCDSGNKYLSKVYNDYWMIDQGFIERDSYGDLRDLISRRHRDHAVVTITPQESLLAALKRMKLYDVSQLPVVAGDRVVGIIDEEDVLLRVFDHEERFNEPVEGAMSDHLVTFTPGTPVRDLMPLFRRGLVAVVAEGEEFLGLVTRMDLLNYLRRRMP